MSNQQDILIAYIVSNVVGIVFLLAAYKNSRLARLLFLLLFGWASWFNFTTARQQPEAYWMYAEHAIGFYQDFINGWFRHHVKEFVTFISVGQAFIALGMLLHKNWVKLACIGAILFLLGIAPLVYYAAFPFSVTVSIAAYFILKRDPKDYLWKNRKTIE